MMMLLFLSWFIFVSTLYIHDVYTLNVNGEAKTLPVPILNRNNTVAPRGNAHACGVLVSKSTWENTDFFGPVSALDNRCRLRQAHLTC